MNINLKKLLITRFKGLQNVTIEFLHETNIYGKNASGKTSIFDALLWLLFGKDSTDRKDFQLKPLDSQGKQIPKTEVEVSASFIIDGDPVTAKKVLKEKWVKKRGELDATFTGNETLFYWNDVPLSAGEYQVKISRIVEENVFKLITNTAYFNAMKWQDRRNVLLTIAGNINDNDVVAAHGEFSGLMKLLSGKSFAEYKREISTRKKKLKDDLDLLPSRISEVNLAMPEPSDFAGIKKQIAELEAEQVQVDNNLMSSTTANAARNNAIRQKQDELHKLQMEVKTMVFEVKSAATKQMQDETTALNDVKFKIEKLNKEKANNLTAYLDAEAKASALETTMGSLRTEWNKINAETFLFTDTFLFDDHASACPTCKQKLPADVIQNKMAELETAFNNYKTSKETEFNHGKKNRLTAIENRGGQLKQDRTSLLSKMEEWKNRNIAIDADLLLLDEQLRSRQSVINSLTNPTEEELQIALNDKPAYVAAMTKISALEAELKEPATEDNNSPLRERKSQLYSQLNSLHTQLNDEQQIEKLTTRKQQLEADIKNFAQQIADLEKTEFLMEKFTKAKMDMLEQRINGMFRYVTFKLFDTQINGAEVECCDVLIYGVPFTDANNAARVNAGVDIINILSEFHNVYAPIFIDNRESVSDLIDTKSQVVNLIVSKPDVKLRVA